MTGRPTKYNEEIALEICAQLSEGWSLRTVCKSEELPSPATVYRWLEKHEEFREQYTRAREVQAEALFDDMLDIADDGSNDWMEKRDKDGEPTGHYMVNGEALQRSRLRVETRKWMAGKLKPKKYGDRSAMEITGADGGPIKTEDVSGVDKLKAFVDGLAKRSGTDSSAP